MWQRSPVVCGFENRRGVKGKSTRGGSVMGTQHLSVETNSRTPQKTPGEKPQEALKKCPGENAGGHRENAGGHRENAGGHSTWQQRTTFLAAKTNSEKQLRDTACQKTTPLGFGFVTRALPIQTWDLTAVLTNSGDGDQPVAPSRGCTVLENESLTSSYCCQFATKWLSSVENRQNSNISSGNTLQLWITLALTKGLLHY